MWDNAYINTGYKPTSNTQAVMDVKVNGTTEYWFGMWNEDYNNGAFALGNNGGNVYVGNANGGGGYGKAISNGRHTVELNKNTAYIDGNVLATLNPSDAFTPEFPLYLFAQNRKGTAYIPDNQKVTCYSFQILENGTLLHYYVPYGKDGVSGLYDLVEGEFFGNSNTEGIMAAINDDVVTENYTIAEYAKINRDAYFDTKFKPTKDTKVEMDVSVNSGNEYWFGVWDNDYKTNAFALGNDANNGGVYAGYGNQGGTDKGGAVSNGRHTLTLDKNKVYVDGVERTSIKYGYSNEGFPIENTLYLFAQNRSGDMFRAGGQKITFYSCKIYDGETLVHYYVPATGNSSGKTVIYDAVTDEYLPFSGNGMVGSYGIDSLKNVLNLTTDGGNFTVTPYGEDTENGTIVVALYDDNNLNKLLDVKTFDLAKTDNLTGTFNQSGYVKAMWWSGLDIMTPLCSPAYGTVGTVFVKVDFRNVDGHDYYPVFDDVPEGVRFYDQSGNECVAINPNITYAMAPKGVTIHTIRAVKESWDNIFEDSSEGIYPYNACEVKDAFIANYLVGGNEDIEKVWRFERNQDEIPPKYNGINISDIWNSYKNNGFLGDYGSVWSSTKYDPYLAYCYSCNSRVWMSQYAYSSNEYILISRDFRAE